MSLPAAAHTGLLSAREPDLVPLFGHSLSCCRAGHRQLPDFMITAQAPAGCSQFLDIPGKVETEMHLCYYEYYPTVANHSCLTGQL